MTRRGKRECALQVELLKASAGGNVVTALSSILKFTADLSPFNAARWLFTSGAVHNAAQRGKDEFVYAFMTLLVIARVSSKEKISHRWRTSDFTMKCWLDAFGCPPYVGQSDLMTLVSNALNVHCTYSLQQLINDCPIDLSNHKISRMLHGKGCLVKQRRPAIVIEDDYDVGDYRDDDEDSGLVDNNGKVSAMENDFLTEILDLREEELSEKDVLSIVDRYEHMGITDDTTSIASNSMSDIVSTTSSQHLYPDKFITIMDDDDADDDEWSCVTTSFDIVDNPPPKNYDASIEADSDTWEITSEVSSVVSLNGSIASGMKKSYLEIARQKGSVVQKYHFPKAISQKPLFDAPQKKAPVFSTRSIQEAEDEPFNKNHEALLDPFFIQEGVKNGRGGRSKLMFKGNQRVTR